MVIRIRCSCWNGSVKYDFALAAGAFLMLLALIAFSCALWSFVLEMQGTGPFVIGSRLFANWRYWLVTSAGVSLISRLLGRYGTSEEDSAQIGIPISIKDPLLGNRQKAGRW